MHNDKFETHATYNCVLVFFCHILLQDAFSLLYALLPSPSSWPLLHGDPIIFFYPVIIIFSVDPIIILIHNNIFSLLDFTKRGEGGEGHIYVEISLMISRSVKS